MGTAMKSSLLTMTAPMERLIGFVKLPNAISGFGAFSGSGAVR